jgi:hypothetical protein
MWWKNYFILFVTSACLAIMLTIFSCGKRGNQDPVDQKASVRMHLTDGPASYDAVYIDIQQVEVTMEGSAAVVLTPIHPGVYNLLDFKNDMDTLLVAAEVPAGKISQIRLILGANNSVVVDGITHALNTPSAQESGLKLNIHETFMAGGSYEMWIDFDAGKSIVETGNGKYNLKPVVRAFATSTDGRIKGYILPAAALATVYVSNGVDTYSAIPDANGFFVIKGLPEGTYNITVDAGLVTYQDVTFSNMTVKYGTTLDLGTVVLIQ